MTRGAATKPRGVRPTPEQIAQVRNATRGKALVTFALAHHTSPDFLGKVLTGAHVTESALLALLARLS